MLTRSFKRLTTSVRRMQENPGLSEGNPGRNKRTWGCLCERAKRLGFGFVESGGGFGISKGTKFWVKNPICPKTGRMYRYTLVVYRYTCSFFFYIVFANWEQWCRCKIFLCQLPSILGFTACSLFLLLIFYPN